MAELKPKLTAPQLRIIHEVMPSVPRVPIFMTDWGKSLTPYLVTTLGITRDEAKQIACRLTPNAGNEMSPNVGKDRNATTRQALADLETGEETNIPKSEVDERKLTTQGTKSTSVRGNMISQRRRSHPLLQSKNVAIVDLPEWMPPPHFLKKSCPLLTPTASQPQS